MKQCLKRQIAFLGFWRNLIGRVTLYKKLHANPSHIAELRYATPIMFCNWVRTHRICEPWAPCCHTGQQALGRGSTCRQNWKFFLLPAHSKVNCSIIKFCPLIGETPSLCLSNGVSHGRAIVVARVGFFDLKLPGNGILGIFFLFALHDFDRPCQHEGMPIGCHYEWQSFGPCSALSNKGYPISVPVVVIEVSRKSGEILVHFLKYCKLWAAIPVRRIGPARFNSPC